MGVRALLDYAWPTGPDLPGGPEGNSAAEGVVELSEVAHRFGARWVLRGCSLRVPAGHALALVGANGSGKTTLLKIMATLLRPKRGGGNVFGADLLTDQDSVRGRVGLLGHAPSLYDDLTAAENLRFACLMRGLRADGAAIRRILDEVGIGSHADTRLRGFSSGMRRRVALGRLLIQPPRLLLMDEPYASFDEEGIELTHELVRRVIGSGGVVVAATHDLPRSLEVVTSALRLADGRLHPVPGVAWPMAHTAPCGDTALPAMAGGAS